MKNFQECILTFNFKTGELYCSDKSLTQMEIKTLAEDLAKLKVHLDKIKSDHGSSTIIKPILSITYLKRINTDK